MIEILRGAEPLCTAGVADSFISRLIGLMFKKRLAHGEGLLIEFSPHLRSRAVHGFFMRFPIDLIFIDKDKRIVDLSTLRSWRVYNTDTDCRWVLEVNEGFVKERGLRNGELLTFAV